MTTSMDEAGRSACIGRFTIDRLMAILARLDQRVQVRVTVRPKRHSGARVHA